MASSKDLDVDQLRRMAALGGLKLPARRAKTLLPLVRALLASCEKLEPLEIEAKGGAGALAPWGGLE